MGVIMCKLIIYKYIAYGSAVNPSIFENGIGGISVYCIVNYEGVPLQFLFLD